MLRILKSNKEEEILQLMREIDVDAYGIKIMLPKAQNYLLKIHSLSNICANILKQEMLSLGADAAVSRGALTGKTKLTDCLIMGNLAQFKRLSYKLQKQPFGLNKVAIELSSALENYKKDSFKLELGKFHLNLGKRAYIMGIVNATPDSFSGDGLYGFGNAPDAAVKFAQKLAKDGADIIDVGGESSRPLAKPVSLKEEIDRVIPVIKKLAKNTRLPISIDTSKAEVAKAALDHGACLINDISGLRNIKMAKIAAKYGAGVVIMHMLGNPRSMQKNPRYKCLIGDILQYLNNAVKTALDNGIAKDKIIIDPGVGFGKTLEDNLSILKNLSEFKVLGLPILVGTSRKSFLGKILHANTQNRLPGTISSCIMACVNGASIVRVHDVAAVKEALTVSDRIRQWN